MKRKIVILLSSIVLMTLFSGTVLADGTLSGESIGVGPATETGDCIPGGFNPDEFPGSGPADYSGDGNPECPC